MSLRYSRDIEILVRACFVCTEPKVLEEVSRCNVVLKDIGCLLMLSLQSRVTVELLQLISNRIIAFDIVLVTSVLCCYCEC